MKIAMWKVSAQNLTLAVVAFCLLISCESRRIDCTRFVFAPKCRGVAAKRGQEVASIFSPGSRFSDNSLSPVELYGNKNDKLLAIIQTMVARLREEEDSRNRADLVDDLTLEDPVRKLLLR